MKLLGALLLVAACTMYGIDRGAGLYKKQRCLAGFIEALQFMQAELLGNARPLPEIFDELSKHAKPEVRGFFTYLSESMSKLGDESVSGLWSSRIMSDRVLSLSTVQRQELCRPGLMLGRYVGQEQATAIESCIARLEPELERATETARNGFKLYTGLGLTAGLMLATAVI